MLFGVSVDTRVRGRVSKEAMRVLGKGGYGKVVSSSFFQPPFYIPRLQEPSYGSFVDPFDALCVHRDLQPRDDS